MLDSVRDRLASFPLDNMSPTTTVGTALSLATAVLAPSGLAADADDDVIMAVDRIPEHPEHQELDVGVGPVSAYNSPLLWYLVYVLDVKLPSRAAAMYCCDVLAVPAATAAAAAVKVH